jgi:hypothetical protein
MMLDHLRDELLKLDASSEPSCWNLRKAEKSLKVGTDDSYPSEKTPRS